MFKIIIKRTAHAGKEKALLDLITRLRVSASGQSDYISGETLCNSAKPSEFLVISAWDRESDWNKWLASDVRKELQVRINELIGPATVLETYQYPHNIHPA